MRDIEIGHLNLEEFLVHLEQNSRMPLGDKILQSGLTCAGGFPEAVQIIDLVTTCVRAYILET